MLRVLTVVLPAVVVGAAAHLLGLPTLMTAALALLAAGAAGGVLTLRRDRFVLTRAGAPALVRHSDAVSVVAAAFPVFTAWIVATVLVNPNVYGAVYSPGATSNYSPVLVALLLPLLALAAYLVVRRAPTALRRAPRLPVVVGVVLAVLLVVKLALAAGLLKVPGFDSGILLLAAYHHEFPAAVTPPYDAALFEGYFEKYPNNLALGTFFSVLFAAAHAVGLEGLRTYMALAIGLNCIALTAVELLSFLVARRLWSTRTAFLVLAATAVFTTLSPWLNTPYSDTFGMLVPIGLLLLWLRLRGAHSVRSRLLHGALLGAVAAVGIALKPTVVFALVAIVLVELVRSRRAFRRRATRVAATSIAGLALVTGVGVSAGITAATNASGLVAFDVWTWKGAAPLTHFMKMGAAGTGGYDFADVQSTFAVPEDERAAAAFRVYGQRVAAMGPEGYAVFLGQKAFRTFADGSFYWGQEGENYPDWFFTDRFSEKVRQWYARDGANHVYLASLWQAGWLLLLIAASLPVARFAPPQLRRVIDTTRLAMLALLAFQLLFETRSRYVYLYLPFVVVMAVGALSVLPVAIADVRARWAPAARRAIGVPRTGDARARLP